MIPTTTTVKLAAMAIGGAFLAACAGTPEDVAAAEAALARCDRPQPVVFDTDMDFDDAAALAMLCQEHEQGRIELLAVTVVNDGAGLPGSAIRHARCVLEACGLTDVPVADGSPVGEHAAAPELQFAVEAVLEGALAGCTASTAPAAISAPELLLEAVRGSRDRVVLLTTGPLTNVEAAIELDRARGRRHGAPLAARVESVYVMGGAFEVPGNLLGTGTETYDGTQELNVWIDPGALSSVLDTFHSVHVVPLDATAAVPVTFEYAARIQAEAVTPEAQIVASIVSQPIVQFGISLGAFYWWDPLAAVAATGHTGIVDFERERISVIEEEGPSSGRTIVDRRGDRAWVGVGADRARFEDTFLAVLNGH